LYCKFWQILTCFKDLFQYIDIFNLNITFDVIVDKKLYERTETSIWLKSFIKDCDANGAFHHGTVVVKREFMDE